MTDEGFATPTTLRFNIGRVMAVAFGVLARNFVPLMAISIALAVPGFLINWWSRNVPVDPQHHNYFNKEMFLGLVVGIVVGSVTQSALTYGTLQSLRGQPVRIGDCLRRGLKPAPKVAMAIILWWLMFMISAMFLLIPGLIVATVLWLTVPAIVVENAGIIGCFGRSRQLTKGHRWPIFGLFLLVTVLYIVIEVVVFKTVGLPNLLVVMQDIRVLAPVALVSNLLVAYAVVMTAVGYYYLRSEKEGIAIDDVAKVFG